MFCVAKRDIRYASDISLSVNDIRLRRAICLLCKHCGKFQIFPHLFTLSLLLFTFNPQPIVGATTGRQPLSMCSASHAQHPLSLRSACYSQCPSLRATAWQSLHTCRFHTPCPIVGQGLASCRFHHPTHRRGGVTPPVAMPTKHPLTPRATTKKRAAPTGQPVFLILQTFVKIV